MQKKSVASGKSDEWLKETWNSYSSQIYNLCRAKCEDKEDAMDVFQNVALRFCQHAKDIEYNDSIYPWLYKVFKNCFYDHVRFRQRLSPFSWASDVMGDYLALPIEKSVFYRSSNQKNDELNCVMRSLSVEDRRLIDLTFKKGLTVEEVSSILGRSFNTVVKRRNSAIKRAKKAMFG